MPRRGIDRALLALGALVVGSALARFALSRGVDAPWIAPDEHLYGLLGRSVVAGDGLQVLGEPVPYYSLLYPLLVGLPFLVGDVATGVSGVQALQALLMSATAIPVYLWSRPVAGSRYALLAAALTVLVPGLGYSGLLMSEALYYPAAVVAVWALAQCLQDPTLARQGFFLVAVAVALATRLQAVGFVGVLVAAVALLAVAERSSAPFRRMLPTFGVLGGLAILWIGSRVVLGGVGELLGAYAPLSEAGEYSVADVAQSIAWQTGALTLLTIGVPLVALCVLTWTTLLGREPDERVRALVAAAISYLVVTVLEVSAFASRFVEHVTERQVLSVAPPVFVAFAVWLHRQAPRPQPATALVALAVAASALLLPLERVATPSAAADALSTIPLEQLSRHVEQDLFELLYASAAALLLLLVVLLPRGLVPALAAVVALALAAGSVSAAREIRSRSQTEHESTFAGAPRDWIDESAAGEVALLVTGDRLWPSAWHQLFWNDAIERVVRLADAESPGVVRQEVVVIRRDGRLTRLDGREVETPALATPAGVTVAGDLLATTPPSVDQAGMALWRTDEPARISQRIVGLRPNGDLHGGESATIRVFACGPGQLELTLLGKQGLPTRVLAAGDVAAERAIPPEGVWRPSIRAPASADGGGVCDFRLETDGLIGSTRIEFVRTG